MSTRREAVIVSTARTGLAKSFRGSFNKTRPDDMVAHAIKAAPAKVPQLDTAEVVAERYKISREAQDEYALTSQQRTAAFQSSGKMAQEIAPMTVKMAVKDKATGQVSEKEVTVDRDECNRPQTKLEDLQKLP